MSETCFWLTDGRFERLRPLLPTDTRGVARVDDRRVISGIVHVLKSGGRWADAPAVYGPRKTLYNRFARWAAKTIWLDIFQALAAAGGPPAKVLQDSTHAKAHRCAAGAKGGRTARDRPLARRADDQDPRPERRPGPAARLRPQRRPSRRLSGRRGLAARPACRQADLPPEVLVLADKAHDTDAIRRTIEAHGAVANIPPRANRPWKNCLSPMLYRGPNAIGRMFGRLKDFRRIATRYDRLATNYLAAIALAATVCYWL